MARTITTAQILELIDRRGPDGEKEQFDMGWVSFDATRKDKPSKHKRQSRLISCGASHDLIRHGQISVKPVDGGHPFPIHLDLIETVNDLVHA